MIESYYQIERDEADIISDSALGCVYSRGKVAVCAPGFKYMPDYWFSKYPGKVLPTWNLLQLFDRTSWILIFVSIVLVTIFFFIAARIGTTHFGIRTFMEEIILSPFR